MPVYEYRCPDCGRLYERLVPMSATDVPPCPGCGGSRAQRLVSAIARPAGDCGPAGAT